jgi:putative sigma-54 modulation protein
VRCRRHVEGSQGLQVSVTFRHVEPTDPLKEYATEKVQRTCAKYLRSPQEAHVILSVVKQRHQAEINVHAKHFDISAHESTQDLYSAIDLAVGKLEAQLRKHKDRINDRKGRTPASGNATSLPVEVFGADEHEAGRAPRVIEKDNIPVKPLSVEDAILQLDLSHAEFLVFRNSATESISVLYKRRDGNYGLITPNP